MKREVEPIHSGPLAIRSLVYEEGPIIVSVQRPKSPSLPTLLLRKKWDKYKADRREILEELDDKSLGVLEENLANKGLSGTHKLLAEPVVDRGVWGQTKGEWKLDGRLFLVFGSLKGRGEIEGSTRTVSSVKFAWSPREGEILISEIPADKLVIRYCSESEAPTVSFEFNARAFIKPVESRSLDDNMTFSRRVLRLPHLNDYLQGNRLAGANLTITAKGLDLLPLPVPESNAS